ncbi:RICIN domain-containing protein [Spirillospora sp. NPDC127200]
MSRPGPELTGHGVRWERFVDRGLSARSTRSSFLNKAGGRAIGIWANNASPGARLAEWVDNGDGDGDGDKVWTLVPTGDGHYRIKSALNPQLFMTGAAQGGAVTVQAGTDTSADHLQQWRLVQ